MIEVYPHLLRPQTNRHGQPYHCTVLEKSNQVAQSAIREGIYWGTNSPKKWIGKWHQPVVTMREKAAADFYLLVSCGHYIIPKTRLSNLSLDVSEICLMTRCLNNYQSFAECDCVNEHGERLNFAEHLRRYHKAPVKLISPEGSLVPLLGFSELLAAGVASGDSEIFGKNLTDAGCIWIKDAQGTTTAARTAKQNFSATFDFSDKVTFDDRQNICKSGVSWNALTSNEQTAFIGTLQQCLQLDGRADLLLLFHRWGSLLEMKEAEKLCLQMQLCLRQQEVSYRSELNKQGFSFDTSCQLHEQDLSGSYYSFFEQAYYHRNHTSSYFGLKS